MSHNNEKTHGVAVGRVSLPRASKNKIPRISTQTKVKAQPNKGKGKTIAKRRSIKKEVNTDNNPKQGEGAPAFKPRKLIGANVYWEYKGARSLGTVVSYAYKRKLFKVKFEDNGTEHLEQNDVLKNMVKDEETKEAPEAPPPSSKKTVGRRRKKDTMEEASTPRKRRKTSVEKRPEVRTSARRAAKTKATGNSEQAGVIAPCDNKINEKPKPKRKYTKKQVKPKQGVAPRFPPRQFIGLYVFMKYKGVNSLGSVVSYCSKTKLFKIGFEDDGTEYLKQNELMKYMATPRHILDAQQTLPASNSSKNDVDGIEQKNWIGEGSSATGVKESTSVVREAGTSAATEGSSN